MCRADCFFTCPQARYKRVDSPMAAMNHCFPHWPPCRCSEPRCLACCLARRAAFAPCRRLLLCAMQVHPPKLCLKNREISSRSNMSANQTPLLPTSSMMLLVRFALQTVGGDESTDDGVLYFFPPPLFAAELRQRSVRIFKPAKTANSSGRAGTSFWRVDFDILQGSARWENPLIGWASS